MTCVCSGKILAGRDRVRTKMKNSNEMIENYSLLQLAVGFLGEKDQAGWWDTNFLSDTGQQMLGMVFSRSALSAGCTSAKEAARHLHDDHIGLGSVFHLFRLPPEIEERVHGHILHTPAAELIGHIESRDSAMSLLQLLAGDAAPFDSEGPTRITDTASIDCESTVSITAKAYLDAFTQGKQCFPYFEG